MSFSIELLIVNSTKDGVYLDKNRREYSLDEVVTYARTETSYLLLTCNSDAAHSLVEKFRESRQVEFSKTALVRMTLF